jgi:hypothetical protein
MRRTVPLVLRRSPAVGGLRPRCDIAASPPTPGSSTSSRSARQSREDVVRLIGSPSAVATFNPNVWYYISEKQENWGRPKPWISEQNVIQITFNESGPRPEHQVLRT